MKRFKYILAATIAILAIASCKKNNPIQDEEWSSVGSVTGTWHMSSWTGLTSADIYVSFNDNGTFDLYQRLYSPVYEHLTGSWTLNEGLLSGTYEDGEPWHADYNVLIRSTGNEMILTATYNADDKATYVKAEIPDEILSGDLCLKSEGNAATAPEFRFL